VEGKIGYGRLINMLNVRADQLVVDEKGLYTVEQFLMARRLMYWQVYLHKTALAAEKMLQGILHLIHAMPVNEVIEMMPNATVNLMLKYGEFSEKEPIPDEALHRFMKLDDVDIMNVLKACETSGQTSLSLLSKGILDRKLFRILESDHPFDEKEIRETKQKVFESLSGFEKSQMDIFVFSGEESSTIYKTGEAEILILTKNNVVNPLGAFPEVFIHASKKTRYYLIYPKFPS
jgi:HD superfamily phosphohydrolase